MLTDFAQRAKQMLEPILAQTGRLLNQNEAALYLFDSTRNELELVMGFQHSSMLQGTRLALGEGVSGRVAQSRKPMLVHDYRHWEGRSNQYDGVPWDNVMAAPLIHHDRLYGVLAISDCGNPTEFSENDLHLLTVFAELVALTLANSELNEQHLNARLQLETLKNHSLVGVYIAQNDRYVYVNDQLANMLGYSKDELMEMSVFDSVVPEDRPMLKQKLRDRYSAKVPSHHYTIRALHKIGAYIHVETFASLIEYNGAPASQGMIIDINQQVERQQLFKRLSELGSEILAETNVNTILEQVCKAIVSHSTFQTASMSVFSQPISWDEAFEVTTLHIAGVTEAEREALLASKDKFGMIKNSEIKTYAKRIGCGYHLTPELYPAMHKISVPISNATKQSVPSKWGPHDTLYVFLEQGELLLGRISLSAPRTGNAPNATQLEPLHTLTNLASLAIQNARKVIMLDKQRDRLQGMYRLGQELVEFTTSEDLFNYVIQKLKADFSYDVCAAMLAEDDKLKLIAHDSESHPEPSATFTGRCFSMEEGVVGWVASNKKPLLINDVAKHDFYMKIVPATKSELCVPILFETNLLGVINIESSKPNAFADGDLQLLSAVSSQLALALTNLDRYQILKHQAIRDELTGLYNRRHFNETLDLEMQRARRYQHPISMLFIDVNDMHLINNRHGHLRGDVLLKEVAQLLQSTARATDIVFRYGGDEFVVLLPETNGQSKVLVKRIKSAIQAWNLSAQSPQMSLSIGISSWMPDSGETLHDLVQQADIDMYRKKRTRS